MSRPELLGHLAASLADRKIEWMLTGSLVSSLQGEPRSTHGIDIVVQIQHSDIDALLRAFPELRFYIRENSVREAIVQKSMFNVLEINEGDKIDFWLLTDEPFDRSRFARKQIEEIDGNRIPISTPEDTVLAKLRWSRLSGGSEKQFRDALRVYEIQHAVMDLQYVEHWAAQLEVESLWSRLQQEAKPLDA